MNICCIKSALVSVCHKTIWLCLFSEEQHRKNVCYTRVANNAAFNNYTSEQAMLIKFSIFVSNALLIQHDSEMDERGWESNQAYLFTLFPLFFIKKTKCQHVISSDYSTQCICNDCFNRLLKLMAEREISSNKFSIYIQYKSGLYLSVIKYDRE